MHKNACWSRVKHVYSVRERSVKDGIALRGTLKSSPEKVFNLLCNIPKGWSSWLEMSPCGFGFHCFLPDRCPSLHPGSLWFMITDGIGCYSCSYINHSLAARLLSCRKFKMVVNTEILLQAWRERWTPLQWLVEVKKLAGKDKKDLDSLAGYLNFILIAKSLKQAGKLFIFWQHIVIEVFETIMNPVSFCKLSLLIWHLSCNFSFNNLVVQQGSWFRGSLTLLPLRHFAVFESQYFLNIKLNIIIQELDLWRLNFRIPVLRNTTQNPATAVSQST